MKSSFKIVFLISFIGLFFNSYALSYKKLIKLADKYYDIDSLEKAELYYNKAFEKKPADYYCNYSLANIYRQRKNYDTALSLINQSINQFPSFVRSYKLRSAIYHSLDKNEEALEDIEKYLLNDFSGDDNAKALRAECNYDLYNFSEALVDYNFVLAKYQIEKWDDFCIPCYNMKTAGCYTVLGDYKSALKYLDLAVNATNCDSKYICISLIERAKIYYVQSEREKSKQDLLSAIVCLKDVYNKTLDSLEMPIINAYLNNEADAIVLIKSQIENHKNNNKLLAEDYYYLGCIYAVLNKPLLAFKNLELSLNLDSNQIKSMKNDLDLINIKNLPEFTQLIQKYQTK